jgi:hypothetical protein
MGVSFLLLKRATWPIDDRLLTRSCLVLLDLHCIFQCGNVTVLCVLHLMRVSLGELDSCGTQTTGNKI